ncbi:MAG TPA: hypothetical protein VNR18_02040 [Hyphomicrobiales bacterium]|nr:hypothetical protein [Hyphomicrobiales bacterium]
MKITHAVEINGTIASLTFEALPAVFQEILAGVPASPLEPGIADEAWVAAFRGTPIPAEVHQLLLQAHDLLHQSLVCSCLELSIQRQREARQNSTSRPGPGEVLKHG